MDTNKIIEHLNLYDDIKNAIDSGLKYNLNNFKFVNSRIVKKLNKNYIILHNMESDMYFIVDINNSFYVDQYKYYAYRIKLKNVYFGNKYDVNKFINDNK